MKKEFIGYALAILSVIASGVFSWYFYDKSQQDRIPVYSTDIFPTTVYDSEESDDRPFKVVLNNGDDLKKDIYLAEHYFWNKGERPILESDVLEKLTVSLDEPSLLSVQIGKTSRKVVGCKVSPIGSDGKSFTITYRVLEEGDGCSVKLFYTGEKYPKVNVDSVIVGVSKIQIYSDSVDDYFEKLPWYSQYMRYIPGFFLIIILGVSLVAIYKSNLKVKPIQLLFYLIVTAQLFLILELRIGNGGFYINSEKPNTEQWVASNPNKSMQPTAKAAAD